MHSQVKIWKLAAKTLEQGHECMLMLVPESSGSSPGRQGFLMCLDNTGNMEGSIGGGMMEHKMVEYAKEKLSSSSAIMDVRKQIHNKTAAKDQSGMICSGEQTIIFYRLNAGNAATVDRILQSILDGRNGTLSISPAGISFSDSIPSTRYYFSKSSEEDWNYEELTGYKEHAHIIGGGHCSLALSQLLKQLDFKVTVYDTRPGLKTMDGNAFADERVLLGEYGGLKNELIKRRSAKPVRSYIIIMTFGYRTDDLALRSIEGESFDYIGLLGSREKIRKMYNEYAKEGLNMSWFDSIKRPVGLDINSHTPMEIAISICAEIISLRNRHD